MKTILNRIHYTRTAQGAQSIEHKRSLHLHINTQFSILQTI
jgi:hypothetical protein